MTAENELKNGNLRLASKCGKMNGEPQLASLCKMQKLTGCGTTTQKCQLLMDPLPFPRHTEA